MVSFSIQPTDRLFGVSLCDCTDLSLGFLILLPFPTPGVVALEEALPRSEAYPPPSL